MVTNLRVMSFAGDVAAATLPTTAPAVRVQELSVAYGRRHVLDGVTFNAAPGEVTAVIGPSGAGKSTLLACLNRLIDLSPDARARGDVRIGATEVLARALDLAELRRRVAMVFQRPTPLPTSIVGNLELPLREHLREPRTRLRERAEAALLEVGLLDEVRDRLHAPAASLSGGQQQRLCLARALALEPHVLLLDEPCSSLDPMSSARIEALVKSLRGRCTVILVTHELAQARRLADWVVLLWPKERGARVIEEGSVARLFSAPEHPLTRSFLGGR